MSAQPTPPSEAPIPSDDWNARYVKDDTPWDLGQANPSLMNALERAHELGLPRPATKGEVRALIPGCGRGHDGLPLLKAGFSVVGIDYAPEGAAAAMARWARYGGRAQTEVADVTQLPDSLTGAFDLTLEHTCFVAIRPGQREAYVENIARALKPKGWMVGVIFTAEKEGGPPYTFKAEELRRLLGERFEILHFEAAEGVLKRREVMGEWALVARLKAECPRP